VRRSFSMFALSMVMLLLFASCTPQQSPPNPVQGPSPVPATSAPKATDAPAAQPVSLITPDVGSSMPWLDGSTLVYVPAGDFIMGNTGQDNPQHTVTLDGFWIYQTKVTNREYDLCVGLGKCQPPLDPQAVKNLSDPTLLDHPVTGVTWDQSQTYCGWVQGHLPTEAQWEKSARGPQGLTYPWGEAKPDATLLNFNNNLGATSKVSDYIKGQSYYSAFDMEGNTFEWVADWYKADYYPTSPQKDPTGPDTGDSRSVRSSSFSSTVDLVPAYLRSFFAPDKVRLDLGFRCVVDKPTAFAPYCQTSQVSGPSTCTTPTAVQTDSGCDDPNGLARGKVSGGTLVSVKSSPPLTKCAFQGQIILCAGPQSVTGQVTACAQTCSVGALSCPAGYKAVLDHQGAPMCVSDQGDPSGPACIAGMPGCGISGPGNNNSNSNSNSNNNNSNNNNSINQVSQGNIPVVCIVGTYYDRASKTCKPLGSGTTNQCAPGYTFNQGCCQAPAGGQYPGCGPNEYFDPASHTCLSVSQPSLGSCVTFPMTTGTCTSNACKPPAGGCIDPLTGASRPWDQASCSCQ